MSGAWAIVQARMGSSRLPGKVLRPLAGRPVLWHLIHRLRACRSLDGILVATSTSPTDDPLVPFCAEEGVPLFRGSEDDVLARYHGAALSVGAELVIRVTGDSPLIDPDTIDRMVALMGERPDADHCIGSAPRRFIHEGFSAVTTRCLQRLVDEVPDHPAAREHVTGYLAADPGFARTVTVPIEESCWFEARVSVDTPADLRFLETLYARLGAPAGDADVRDVVRLLKREPDLVAINAHVARKHLEVRDDRVLVRCDGGRTIGLGHVTRCAALGDALREGHACGVVFAMRGDDIGLERARALGFPVEDGTAVTDADEGAWIEELLERHHAGALVLDVRTPLSRAAVERLRARTVVVVIDDASDRRLAADLVVLPPVPQLQALTWEGFDGELLTGWEYVLLRRALGAVDRPAPSDAPRLLVTMGGADSANLTARLGAALDRLDVAFEGVLLVGAAYAHVDSLRRSAAGWRHTWRVEHAVGDVGPLFASCDLAVASFGVTAYELCTVGTPAVLVSWTPDHAASASALVAAEAALDAGPADDAVERRVAAEVDALLRAPSRLVALGAAGRALLDGRGADRIAERIVAAVRGTAPSRTGGS